MVVVEFVDLMLYLLIGLLKIIGMELCLYVELNIEFDVFGSGICFIFVLEGL